MDGIQRFSTRGMRDASRVELWEQHNARALVGLDARTLTEAPLEASETNLELSRLQFAHVAANAHVVERTSRHIAASPTDGVTLYFTLFGDSFFYHREGVHLLKPGSLLVCDVNEPFMRGFAHGLQEFAVRIPGTTFDELSDAPVPGRPIIMNFSNVPGANAHAAALATLVKSTLASSDGDLTAAEETAMDLLRAIFSQGEARSSSAHRRQALAYADQHLRDPRLSVGQIATAIGVSERHLSRIFADTGTGPARVILEKRLNLARRILDSADASSRSVSGVAAYCGFSSHSHFTRVYRERFGETPAQTRQRHS